MRRPSLALVGLVLVGLALVGLASLLAAGLAARLWLPGHGPAAWFTALQQWGSGSWLAFLVLQTLVAASGILPASLAGVGAGAVFGLAEGFLLAAASTFAGALASFALSRSMFRPVLARLLARRAGFRRLDAAVAQDGWRSVCLLRLSPVMPFAVTSYALGLTGMGWRDYVLGTLASLPSLLCYVALGHFMGSGVAVWRQGGSPISIGLLAVGAVATVALVWRMGAMARRSLAGGA